MAKKQTPKAPRAWQRMLSGRRLDLIDPSPFDVEISDIAHGLARVARWNGQTIGDYAFSVAQHCIIVEQIVCDLEPGVSAEIRQMALLHDAAEYVIGDMISPFKAILGGNYHEIEARLEAAIHLRYSLPPKTPASVKKLIKQADHIAAYFEGNQLAGFSAKEARELFGQPKGISGDRYILEPKPPQTAQQEYENQFSFLEKLREKEGS